MTIARAQGKSCGRVRIIFRAPAIDVVSARRNTILRPDAFFLVILLVYGQFLAFCRNKIIMK
ncbi:MAG: hypothetical protein BHV77_11700 [Bacteroides sp. 43_108]|nr:MAG: hypothetical protein BHV77_11700 [Bacteroides sp. 43_108]